MFGIFLLLFVTAMTTMQHMINKSDYKQKEKSLTNFLLAIKKWSFKIYNHPHLSYIVTTKINPQFILKGHDERKAIVERRD